MVLIQDQKDNAEKVREQLKRSLDYIKTESENILKTDDERLHFWTKELLVPHSNEEVKMKERLNSAYHRSSIKVIEELVESIKEFDKIIRDQNNFIKFLQDVGFRGFLESDIIRDLNGRIYSLKKFLSKLDGHEKYFGVNDINLINKEIDVALTNIRNTEMLIDRISKPINELVLK